MLHVLYFNGLGSGKTRKRESFAMRYLAKRGIEVEHVPIDWRSDELPEKLLARLVELTEAKLKEYDKIVCTYWLQRRWQSGSQCLQES